MRVLHVTPSLARAYGGPTHSLLGYAHAATEAAIRLEVVAPEPPTEDREWLARELAAERVEFFPASGGGAFVRSAALLRWVADEAARFDLVHVHGVMNPISSFAIRAAQRRGVPVLVRPFGMLSRYAFTHRRRLLKRAIFALVDRPSLRRVAGFHFTTRGELDGARWLGLPLDERSFVVPPPCPVPAAGPVEEGSPGGPTVLTLARLHPVKRIEALIEAWPKVLAARPDARLVVGGDGDAGYVRSLRALAEASGAGEAIRFTGFVTGSAKGELLRSADLFVLPSLHENFGVVVVEALAAGRPVVVSPDVQLASFVASNGLGLVSDGTPGSLAASILQALGDATLRSRCRVDGPALARRHFSPEAVASALMSMYEAVAR